MPFSDLANMFALPEGFQAPGGNNNPDPMAGLNFGQRVNYTMQRRPGMLSALGAGLARGDFASGLEQAGKIRAGYSLDERKLQDAETSRQALKQYLMSQGMSEAEAEQASQNEAVTKHIFDLQELEKRYALQDAASSDLGLQIQWGMGSDGKWHAYQLGKNGQLREVQPGNGVEMVPPGDIAAAKAGGTAQGKAGGEAAASLPQIESDIAEADAALGDVLNDPQMTEMVGNIVGPGGMPTGIPRRMKPNLSEAARTWQKKFDLLKGQAWKQARESLKGAGPITDYEGNQATAAIEAMDAATSIKAFREAADDFRWYMHLGLWKAKKRAADAGQGEDPGPRPRRDQFTSTAASAGDRPAGAPAPSIGGVPQGDNGNPLGVPGR